MTPDTAPFRPALPGGPDAELIRLCAEFDVLERRVRLIGDAFAAQMDQTRADMLYPPLQRRQGRLLPRIRALRARTPEGIMARARTLALYDPDLIERAQSEWSAMMVAALVRDLVTGAGA